jgi:hypothetical protein
MTMALIAFSNSIWLMWPEGLMVAAAVIYLSGIKSFTLDGPSSSTRVRLMAFIGLFTTASLLLLGTRPNLYTIIAIPVIPAPFVFGILILRPRRILNWTKIRIYLTVCVVASALCWTTQIIWLLTR